MPELSFTVVAKLFLLLRVLPVVETVSLYLLLIGGVSFIALSICALIFITDVKHKTQKKIQKQKKPTSWNGNNVKKHEYKTEENKSPADVKNKEMDVYFCSLLSPNSEDNDDVKVPLTSSTDWFLNNFNLCAQFILFSCDEPLLVFYAGYAAERLFSVSLLFTCKKKTANRLFI